MGNSKYHLYRNKNKYDCTVTSGVNSFYGSTSFLLRLEKNLKKECPPSPSSYSTSSPPRLSTSVWPAFIGAPPPCQERQTALPSRRCCALSRCPSSWLRPLSICPSWQASLQQVSRAGPRSCHRRRRHCFHGSFDFA